MLSFLSSRFTVQEDLVGNQQEPLGEVERKLEDAGPATRNRKRPEPVDPAPPRARLPRHPETPEELKREVASRKGC